MLTIGHARFAALVLVAEFADSWKVLVHELFAVATGLVSIELSVGVLAIGADRTVLAALFAVVNGCRALLACCSIEPKCLIAFAHVLIVQDKMFIWVAFRTCVYVRTCQAPRNLITRYTKPLFYRPSFQTGALVVIIWFWIELPFIVA